MSSLECLLLCIICLISIPRKYVINPRIVISNNFYQFQLKLNMRFERIWYLLILAKSLTLSNSKKIMQHIQPTSLNQCEHVVATFVFIKI
jgi:hypothetical protein